MNLFEIIVLDTIYAGFPILIYLFYVAYNKNIEREENDLILDFIIFLSFYLIYHFGIGLFEESILAINVPLLIAYLKKRTSTAIALSAIIIIYYGDIFHFNMYVLVLEYLFYYLFFKMVKKTKRFIYLFIIIKAIFILLLLTNINGAMLVMTLLSFVALYIIVLVLFTFIEKGEEILNYHMSIKSIEEEKQVRESLFKITHEIKNPLAVIKGYLEMFDNSDINHTKKYIPIIKEEVDKTLLLLQDFLCMTKIKTDKDIMDINLLLEEVSNIFKPILKKQKIEFLFYQCDEDIYINGDYNRLMQVMINIIKNSIEASDKGGYIVIKLKNQKRNVKITVEDKGYGMNKELLEKIKEPFFTTKKNGTGLGVSLSYEIISQHNGTINYKSKEKEGTCVTIVLPKIN